MNSEWAVVRVRKLDGLGSQWPPKPQIQKDKHPVKEQPRSASQNEDAAVEEERLSKDKEQGVPHTGTLLQTTANLSLQCQEGNTSDKMGLLQRNEE